MVNIIVKPEDMYDFYNDYGEQIIENDYLLANDDESGIEIYISTDGRNNPWIDIYENEYLIDQIPLLPDVSAVDLKSWMELEMCSVYDEYGITDQYDFDEFEYNEMMVEDRENELATATEDFLDVLLMGAEEKRIMSKDEIEECKNQFVKFVTLKFGISVYRPCVVDGKLVEYPYKE